MSEFKPVVEITDDLKVKIFFDPNDLVVPGVLQDIHTETGEPFASVEEAQAWADAFLTPTVEVIEEEAPAE